MKFKKILFAADLAAGSGEMFRNAAELAQTFDAELHILHVIEELSPAAIAALQWVNSEKITEKHYADFQKDSIEKIRAAIRDICEGVFKSDPSCRAHFDGITVVIGYPADEILRKLDDLNCDALIMGTHSKGFIAHTFLGSVAERVLRRIRKPAIVLPVA